MKISVLKSKIHRAVITQAELDYIGSITIDEDLMDSAGIYEYEHVHIVNVNSGSRIETYAIAGERGSGVICLNGAAARSGQKGDHIIIMSYADMSPEELKENPPKVVFVDDNNKIIRTARYEKHGGLEDLNKNPVPDKKEFFGNPDNWKIVLNKEASAEFEYTGNSITINAKNASKRPVWPFDIEGEYTGIALMANKKYHIEFDYKSSVSTPFVFRVQHNYAPWPSYYTYQLESSVKKQHYSGDFTSPVSDNNVSIAFCFFGTRTSPYIITFENISLTEYE